MEQTTRERGMTDSERIQAIREIYGTCTCRDCMESNELFLLTQLDRANRDRDGAIQVAKERGDWWQAEKQQNTVMLSALRELRRWIDDPAYTVSELQEYIDGTIAQVKG